MGKINREDMLELTRRMTLKRNCFDRIAGAYLDEEGFLDGTFNKHFQKLSTKDQKSNLEIAKTVPFSETNVQLREYLFEEAQKGPGSIWQLLMALRECGLKKMRLLICFMRSSDKSTGPAEAMLFISFTAAMTCRKRPRTRKASGNLRRSTSLSSVRSVRSAEIMSPESRNAGSSSRRLRTGAEMATGSISFRRTGGLGKGWRRFSFPDKCYVVLLT